jgi:hypothetical protein
MATALVGFCRNLRNHRFVIGKRPMHSGALRVLSEGRRRRAWAFIGNLPS